MPNDGASLPDDRALVFTILRLPACSVAPTVNMLCSKAYCQLRDDGASPPDDAALVLTLRRFLACSEAPTVDSFSGTLCSIASDRNFSGGATTRLSSANGILGNCADGLAPVLASAFEGPR